MAKQSLLVKIFPEKLSITKALLLAIILLFSVGGILYGLSLVFFRTFSATFILSPLLIFLPMLLIKKNQTIKTGLLIFLAGLFFSSLVLMRYYPRGSKIGMFFTVQEAKSLADKLVAKNIEMEGNNPLKPSYEKYYRSMGVSFLAKKIMSLKALFGLSFEMPWPEKQFVSLVKAGADAAPSYKYPATQFVLRRAVEAGSNLIVFGDLQGSFDSLARDCAKLLELGLIDEKFKLKSDKDYIFVTGDAISRSPYQLEMLSLIFLIWFANPKNFIYIRGNHEENNYWYEYGLKTELEIRCKPFSSDPIPFDKEINKVFSVMPSGVYLKMPDAEPSFLRLSHFGAERSNLFVKETENKLFKFVSEATTSLDAIAYDAVKDEPANKEIPLKAIIKSEKKRETYQDMDGMRLMPAEAGVTSWTIMSCPSEVFQKGVKFFFDAFAVIKVEPKIEDTLITLYKQDVRTKDGFKDRKVWLVSGQDYDPNKKPEPKKEDKNKKDEKDSEKESSDKKNVEKIDKKDKDPKEEKREERVDTKVKDDSKSEGKSEPAKEERSEKQEKPSEKPKDADQNKEAKEDSKSKEQKAEKKEEVKKESENKKASSEDKPQKQDEKAEKKNSELGTEEKASEEKKKKEQDGESDKKSADTKPEDKKN